MDKDDFGFFAVKDFYCESNQVAIYEEFILITVSGHLSLAGKFLAIV